MLSSQPLLAVSLPNMVHQPNDLQPAPKNRGPEDDPKPSAYAILAPCRVAMKGKFPLHGTYFQTNEVFLDHTSLAAGLPEVRLA